MLLKIQFGNNIPPTAKRKSTADWFKQNESMSVEFAHEKTRSWSNRLTPLVVTRQNQMAMIFGAVYETSWKTQTITEEKASQWLDDFSATGNFDFLKTIDGQFLIIFVDVSANRCLIAGDMRSLAPAYYYHSSDCFILGHSASEIISAAQITPTLSYGSIVSGLVNGLFLGNNTYYNEIKRLFPGEYVFIEKNKVQFDRYYRRNFQQADGLQHEELAECIEKSVLTEFERAGNDAVFAISGGVDSRAILAVMLKNKIICDSVTWGFDRLDLPFGDYQAGEKLAKMAGLPHQAIPLDADKLADNLPNVVQMTDGLLFHVGLFSEGLELMQTLGERYKTILFGAQYLGMGYRGYGLSNALLVTGIRQGLYLRAGLSLLRSELRKDAYNDYYNQLANLLKPYRHMPTADIQDIMDYNHTSPQMEASQHQLWARFIYPSCPLTSRAILEMSNRLTIEQRNQKSFFTQTVLNRLWPAQAMPLNSKHSRINWEERMRQGGKMAKGLSDIILKPGKFYDIFDENILKDWLNYIIPESSENTSPCARSPMKRFYQKLLWKRTRAIEVAHLAVLRLASDCI